MKPIALVSHRIPSQGLERLYEVCQVHYPHHAVAFTPEELMALAPQVDAILAGGEVTGAFIQAAPKLRIISNYGAGYDRVDVAAATQAGVPVTNLPEPVAYPTAELALGLLLAVTRRIGELNMRMRREEPLTLFGMGKHMGHSLQGRRLGIVGMGSIGGKLAGMARALGMEIGYHNRCPLPPEKAQGARYMPLEQLMRESDAISIHCPLTTETRGLIGGREIGWMKPEAVLVNTARGPVVDYEALAQALKTGRIMGAGLDVYPHEPHVPTELVALDNAVLVPHIGSNTHEDRRNMSLMATRHIVQALAGERPDHVVNPQIYG